MKRQGLLLMIYLPEIHTSNETATSKMMQCEVDTHTSITYF